MEIRRFVIAIVSKFDPRGFRQAEAAARKFKGEATGATRATDGVEASTRKAAASTREYAGATRQAGEAQARTNAQVRDAAGKYSGAGGAAAKSGRSWQGFSANLKGAAAVAKMAAVAFAAAAAAVAAVAIPVLRTGIEFEQLQTRLTTLLGGTQQADEAFKFIKDFAADTPFQLQEVTKAFIDLKTRGVDPTRQRLTALGDLSSSFGENLQSITDAIAAAARGENDPIEKFGISAKASGDKVILSFKDQKVAVERNAEAITDALVKFGEMEGIQGAMAAQSKTLAGQISNAKDALDGFLNTAAQAGPMERVSEILGELREKFMSSRNAELLGKALDEIFTAIRDAFRDVDAKDVTAGFELLVNVIKLLLFALKPFIWVWKQLVGVLGEVAEASDRAVNAAEAFNEVIDTFTNVLTGAMTLSGGITQLGESFGFLASEAEGTGHILDGLGEKARKTVDEIKKAVSGAVTGGMTDDELREIANNQALHPEAREAAQRERIKRANAKAAAAAAAAEKKRVRDEQRFDPTMDLDKAAQDVGEGEAAKEFKRLRKAGVSEEEAKRQSSVFGVKAEEAERKRLGEGGKIRKKGGKGDQFFDFEKEAKQAAKSQGETFAGQELQRLRSEGVAVDLALQQSREAGKKRADELEQRFLEAGRVFDASADNILDILGLRGPGSVLEGRPPPQTLLITFAPVFKFIETFQQTIQSVDGAKALAEVTGKGGEAAANAGLAEGYDRFKAMFEAMLGLMVDRLQKADGGGRLPAGPQG